MLWFFKGWYLFYAKQKIKASHTSRDTKIFDFCVPSKALEKEKKRKHVSVLVSFV